MAIISTKFVESMYVFEEFQLIYKQIIFIGIDLLSRIFGGAILYPSWCLLFISRVPSCTVVQRFMVASNMFQWYVKHSTVQVKSA